MAVITYSLFGIGSEPQLLAMNMIPTCCGDLITSATARLITSSAVLITSKVGNFAVSIMRTTNLNKGILWLWVTDDRSYYGLPAVATRPGFLKYNECGKYSWIFCP